MSHRKAQKFRSLGKLFILFDITKLWDMRRGLPVLAKAYGKRRTFFTLFCPCPYLGIFHCATLLHIIQKYFCKSFSWNSVIVFWVFFLNKVYQKLVISIVHFQKWAFFSPPSSFAETLTAKSLHLNTPLKPKIFFCHFTMLFLSPLSNLLLRFYIKKWSVY